MIARFAPLALASILIAGAPARAQEAGDVGRLLREAEAYTVRVRATATWPFPLDNFGTGQGTGFIIDRQRGWIITNAHVARRSPGLVEIAFGDGEWQKAERVYVDNVIDMAVLRLPSGDFPPEAGEAKLGCNGKVRQGSNVAAYGHPANLMFTATRGIVSSVREFGYQEFIQLDAQLNPGSSGGPLLALDSGEVIGINTSTLGSNTGLGFATPMRHICPIVAMLKEGADPTAPFLPVYWLRTGRSETLTVARPYPGSAAEGLLKPGDVVTGLAGGPRIAVLSDLTSALRGLRGEAKLSVRRGKDMLDVTVPLIEQAPMLKRRALIFAGMLVMEDPAPDVDWREADLRIVFVRQGEEAARRGVFFRDQIETVNGQRFNRLAELETWLRSRPKTERVSLYLKRPAIPGARQLVSDFHLVEVQIEEVKSVTPLE